MDELSVADDFRAGDSQRPDGAAGEDAIGQTFAPALAGIFPTSLGFGADLPLQVLVKCGDAMRKNHDAFALLI